jgi:selenocysteine lyase/cysteine desulfurase
VPRHKATVVIDAISKYYQEINANIHRGVHFKPATDAYETHVVKFKTTSMLNFLSVIYSWNHFELI